MTTPSREEAPEREHCPFCGHDDPQWTMLAGHKLATVSCGKCHARGPTVAFEMKREPIDTTVAPAFAAWNTRADLANREPSEGDLAKVWAAIEAAKCPHRQGPYGGFDYGYRAENPPAEPYVIRDMRDPNSPTWDAIVHRTADSAEHEAVFKKLTEQHIARAAINAWRNP